MKRAAVILLLALSACSSKTDQFAERCEGLAKSKLRSPSTYKRINMQSFTNGNIRSVFIDYDAANAFGVPIRDTQICEMDTKGGKDLPDTFRDMSILIQINATNAAIKAIEDARK